MRYSQLLESGARIVALQPSEQDPVNDNALAKFLAKLETNPDLQRDFAALAARYGIHFTDRELSEEELATIAGGFSAQPDTQQVQSEIQQNLDGMLKQIMAFLKALEKSKQPTIKI